MHRRALVVLALCCSAVAFAQDAATQQLLADADEYYDRADYGKAASSYDRAIRSQPKDVPPAAYAKRASIFLFKKEYEQGLRWITTVAEPTWPGDDAVLEQKAIVLSRLPDRRRDAVELAERVVKQRPQSYTLHVLLGDYYFQAGAASAEQTASHYQAFFQNRPADLAGGDGLVRVKLGFSYLHLARFQDAEKQFDEAIRAGNQDAALTANARKGLCAAYAGAGTWDRALTICERVIGDAQALRGDSSPNFNLGVAYLARERLGEALEQANLYIQQRPRDAKGYLLRGQVFIRQGKLAEAERELNRAEELAPTDPRVARELGRVYLRQKRAQKAIDKLARAAASNPNDVDTVIALAEAYIADGQGVNAATQAERGLKLSGQERNFRLAALAGEGYYVAGQLGQARSTFEKILADKQGASDQRVRQLLVDCINKQAAQRMSKDDLAGAEQLLAQALRVDPESSRTNFNLGLIALEKGDGDTARKFLAVRLKKTPQDLMTNRLMARAYAVIGDDARAREHYARAEAEAKARRSQVLLAEIYTEWGPLLIEEGKLDEALDKLELAAAQAVRQPFEKTTKRNLQLAHFRRGYDRLRLRRDSVGDLEAAVRDPSVLTPDELAVFNFALGLAYLDSGAVGRAQTMFQQLVTRAKQSGGNLAFLKPPYNAIGAELFLAYGYYREPSLASRQRAVPLFDKLASRLGGDRGAKMRDLLRSSWELVAFDQYARGSAREADAALDKAEAVARTGGDAKLSHNKAVLDMDRNPDGSRATLRRLADRVPEALVNLGILAERDGDAKAAYDFWVQARSRGARTARLDEWIEAKKRLFGF
jgi:tetratricopeptide (TPR) repeat protein